MLRALADLGPADAVALSQGKMRARAQRKLGSLARHVKTYDLSQRVDLWIVNRVFGKSPLEIASEMQQADVLDRGWIQVIASASTSTR